MFDPENNSWVQSRENFVMMMAGKHNGQSNRAETIMRHLIEESKKAYTCLRPPGAAGALLMAQTNYVFAGVFPTENSPTCKEVGCEIEYDGIPNPTKLPPGILHKHCVRNIHAEQRAILIAAKYGIATQGAIMFSVLKPCYQCTKHIIAAGISEIFYAGAAYDELRTENVLANAGVFCTKVDAELEYGQ